MKKFILLVFVLAVMVCSCSIPKSSPLYIYTTYHTVVGDSAATVFSRQHSSIYGNEKLVVSIRGNGNGETVYVFAVPAVKHKDKDTAPRADYKCYAYESEYSTKKCKKYALEGQFYCRHHLKMHQDPANKLCQEYLHGTPCEKKATKGTNYCKKHQKQ